MDKTGTNVEGLRNWKMVSNAVPRTDSESPMHQTRQVRPGMTETLSINDRIQ